MKRINRREALALLAAVPVAARLRAETRVTAKHRVILGSGHGFLVEPGGTLQAWHTGAQRDGLAIDALGLGHNPPLAAHTLAPVPNLKNVVTAAAGTGCSFAVLADGRLLAWGLNAGNGLLGSTPLSVVETTASWGPNANTPVPLATKIDAIDVSTQDSHVLALARDGSVYAWGKGDRGQLGIGPLPVINFKTRTPSAMAFVPFPMRIPDLADVTAISAGRTHSLALIKDGTIRAWGENQWGQLGDGTTDNRARPALVQGVRNAVAIAAGYGGFSAALLADGTVMTWGTKTNGVLGRPPWTGADAPSPTPALVPNLRGIRAIGAGTHMNALTQAGTVITWGDAFTAAGRTKGTTEPGVISSLTGVQSLSIRAGTSIAVLASGRVMTWGVVRPWTRPEGTEAFLSRYPILLWIDGLEQP